MLKENCNLQHFTTEDLHFAAYLKCCDNLEFKGVLPSDHEETKLFAFEGDSKYIDELLLNYYNRRGKVEPQRYTEEEGMMRDLVKIEKSKKSITCEVKGNR